jgi:DNA-binding response OmpR family regulator
MVETATLEGSEIRIGANSVDLSGRLRTPYGDWLYLTPLESGLLSCLAQHAGNPVTVSELLRKVWGCSSEAGGTAAQVKNCVWRLRNKLEPRPHEPRYLLAVRGHGYLLNTTVDTPSS